MQQMEFNLDSWSGKTSPERCPQTVAKTSPPSSKKQSKSSSRKPPIFLCLQRDGQTGGGYATLTEDSLSAGVYSTRNTGESPSAAVESRLSRILEEMPQEKYYLSAKACLGILNRAKKRGKELPLILKNALIRQSQEPSRRDTTEVRASTEDPTSYTMRIRGGREGGGKGPLIQTEQSGTLATQNDQTVFCFEGNGSRPSHRGAGWSEGEVSYTVNTVDRHAVASFKLGNSGEARSIGYSEELAPTLNADCGGNKPAVIAYSLDPVASNSMKSSNPHSGFHETETARTVDTAVPDPSKNQGGIAILDMTHADEVIRNCGEKAPTLNSRMGTGGNQVPLAFGIGNGQVDSAMRPAAELSFTLDTMHDPQAIMAFRESSFANYEDDEQAGSVRASGGALGGGAAKR